MNNKQIKGLAEGSADSHIAGSSSGPNSFFFVVDVVESNQLSE